jgi:hypothetical protein
LNFIRLKYGKRWYKQGKVEGKIEKGRKKLDITLGKVGKVFILYTLFTTYLHDW